MTFITYSVCDWTDEPEHGGFSVICSESDGSLWGRQTELPMFFATREEARAWIQAEFDAINEVVA